MLSTLARASAIRPALVRIMPAYVSAPEPACPSDSLYSATTSTSPPTSAARVSARSSGDDVSAKIAGTPSAAIGGGQVVDLAGAGGRLGGGGGDHRPDHLEPVAVGEVAEHVVVGDQLAPLGRDAARVASTSASSARSSAT